MVRDGSYNSTDTNNDYWFINHLKNSFGLTIKGIWLDDVASSSQLYRLLTSN